MSKLVFRKRYKENLKFSGFCIADVLILEYVTVS